MHYLQSPPRNGRLQFADLPDGVEQAAAQLHGLVIAIAPEDFVPTVKALQVSDVVMA